MTERQRRILIERSASADRERDAHGRIKWHPAWHDLAPDDRDEVYRVVTFMRTLEAAADAEGLSNTGRVVLDRIRAQR